MRPPINTHEQLVAAGGGVAITKAYATGGHFSGWGIYRVRADGLRVDTAPPGAPWYWHGVKRFNKFPRAKDALAEAKRYVAETFGYEGPWTRNRMGDYVPTAVHKAHPLRRDRPGGTA